MCGYGSQEALPLRPAREGELYFPEDREVNLVELALAGGTLAHAPEKTQEKAKKRQEMPRDCE